MNKKKIIGIGCGGVVVLALVFVMFMTNSETTLTEEIDSNFAKMSELNTQAAVSSNPYEYINNEYYDNIVNMGMPAVAILEEKYHKGEYKGLDGYIAALAIQEITEMNLQECNGTDWETAEQFFQEWDETLNTLPDTFNKIIKSDDTLDRKIRCIEEYGVFGQEFLASINSEHKEMLDYYGTTIKISDELQKKIQESSLLPSKEIEKIEEYLESHMS